LRPVKPSRPEAKVMAEEEEDGGVVIAVEAAAAAAAAVEVTLVVEGVGGVGGGAPLISK